MARVAHCPHCELVYKLQDDAPEGQEVICEHCRQPFTLQSVPRRPAPKPDETTGLRRWRGLLIGNMRRLAIILACVLGPVLLYLTVVKRQQSQEQQIEFARQRAMQEAETWRRRAMQAEQQLSQSEHQPANRTRSLPSRTAAPEKPASPATQPPPDPPHPREDGVFRVVVDASFGADGWKAQSTATDDAATPSPAASVLQQMQDRGWTVDVVPYDYRASPPELARIRKQLLQTDLLIRPVGSGRRRSAPTKLITACQEAVRNGTVLLLWGHHPVDELAAGFGLRFNWLARGFPLNSIRICEMTTGFDKLEGDWVGINRMPIEAVELAWVKLNPPNQLTMPVLGYLPYGEGLVIFCGADQGLTEPMQQYLLSLATAVNTQGDRIKISLGRIRQLQASVPAQTSPRPAVPGSGRGRSNQRPERPPGPVLLSPADGATLPQPSRHRWEFDWDDVENVAEYHVIVVRVEDPGSVIRLTSRESHLTVEPGTFDIDEDRRTGWTWYVRAIAQNGDRSNWSRRRPFEISSDPEFTTTP